MAARKNRGVDELPDDWKNKIRASAILNRLNDCVAGQIELTSQQIKAADIILKKIVPDLARTELQPLGKDGQPVDPTIQEVRISLIDTRPTDT